MISLDSQIEAILFFKGEPVSLKKLCEILNKETKEIGEALNILEENLENRGINLMIKDGEIVLGTSPEMSGIIESIKKEELVKDLGKAGIETLTVVLYKGPLSRSEIDYIRGVNSNFILRNLMIRGLVEKISNPNDARSFLYRPTFELLSFMGISKIEDLPEYQKAREEMGRSLEAEKEQEEQPNLKTQEDK